MNIIPRKNSKIYPIPSEEDGQQKQLSTMSDIPIIEQSSEQV
jgi:hypothetical protein